MRAESVRVTPGGNTETRTGARESVVFEAPLELWPKSGAAFAPAEFAAGRHAWRFKGPTVAGFPSTFEREGPGGAISLQAFVSAKMAVPWGVDPEVEAPFYLA